MLGLPQYTNIGLQFGSPHTQSWELHFYGEDTYKATPRLTLIYGLRYEFQNPYTEVGNNMSNFDPTTNLILIAGRGGNSDALINARKNDFSPRLGLAYKVSPRTVLRAGYGLFYTPENDAREDVLTKNYPFGPQQLLYNSPYVYAPYYPYSQPRISDRLRIPRITTLLWPRDNLRLIPRHCRSERDSGRQFANRLLR